MGVTYQVRFMPGATRDLARLDRIIAQRVLTRLRWLSDNFEGLTPEALTGEWRGLLKLRVGSYRVIYTAMQKERLITVHLVGHRRDIYKTK